MVRVHRVQSPISIDILRDAFERFEGRVLRIKTFLDHEAMEVGQLVLCAWVEMNSISAAAAAVHLLHKKPLSPTPFPLTVEFSKHHQTKHRLDVECNSHTQADFTNPGLPATADTHDWKYILNKVRKHHGHRPLSEHPMPPPHDARRGPPGPPAGDPRRMAPPGPGPPMGHRGGGGGGPPMGPAPPGYPNGSPHGSPRTHMPPHGHPHHEREMREMHKRREHLHMMQHVRTDPVAAQKAREVYKDRIESVIWIDDKAQTANVVLKGHQQPTVLPLPVLLPRHRELYYRNRAQERQRARHNKSGMPPQAPTPVIIPPLDQDDDNQPNSPLPPAQLPGTPRQSASLVPSGV